MNVNLLANIQNMINFADYMEDVKINPYYKNAFVEQFDRQRATLLTGGIARMQMLALNGYLIAKGQRVATYNLYPRLVWGY